MIFQSYMGGSDESQAVISFSRRENQVPSPFAGFALCKGDIQCQPHRKTPIASPLLGCEHTADKLLISACNQLSFTQRDNEAT